MFIIKSYVNFPDLLIEGNSLRNFDFSHKKLHRYMLREYDLSFCDFRFIDGRNTCFERAILNFSNFSNADLMCCSFDECALKNVIFKDANLNGASFKNASLVNADMTNADIGGVNFRFADLTGIVLTNAHYDIDTEWPDDFDPVSKGAVTQPA